MSHLKGLTTFRVCECQSAEREFPFVAIFGRGKVHDLAGFTKRRRWMAAIGIKQKQRLLISPRENDDAKEMELFVEAHANIAGTCVSQGFD